MWMWMGKKNGFPSIAKMHWSGTWQKEKRKKTFYRRIMTFVENQWTHQKQVAQLWIDGTASVGKRANETDSLGCEQCRSIFEHREHTRTRRRPNKKCRFNIMCTHTHIHTHRQTRTHIYIFTYAHNRGEERGGKRLTLHIAKDRKPQKNHQKRPWVRRREFGKEQEPKNGTLGHEKMTRRIGEREYSVHRLVPFSVLHIRKKMDAKTVQSCTEQKKRIEWAQNMIRLLHLRFSLDSPELSPALILSRIFSRRRSCFALTSNRSTFTHPHTVVVRSNRISSPNATIRQTWRLTYTRAHANMAVHRHNDTSSCPTHQCWVENFFLCSPKKYIRRFVRFYARCCWRLRWRQLFRTRMTSVWCSFLASSIPQNANNEKENCALCHYVDRTLGHRARMIVQPESAFIACHREANIRHRLRHQHKPTTKTTTASLTRRPHICSRASMYRANVFV